MGTLAKLILFNPSNKPVKSIIPYIPSQSKTKLSFREVEWFALVTEAEPEGVSVIWYHKDLYLLKEITHGI